MIKTVETTVGRRYAGWFIRNGEYAQRVLDGLKNAPLPGPGPANGHVGGKRRAKAAPGQGGQKPGVNGTAAAGGASGTAQEKKVTWKV